MRIIAPLMGLVLLATAAGCKSSSHVEEREAMSGLRAIPQSAELERDAHGSSSFRAPAAGRAYVYDFDEDLAVWTGTVQQGDRVSIDPAGNHIWIGDNEAYHRPLSPGHRHRIYFDKF